MDLVFVLKWAKSVIGFVLYIFHLSDTNAWIRLDDQPNGQESYGLIGTF